MNFLGHVCPPFAVLDILESTHQTVQRALGPPALEDVLAAENAALRESLIQWQEYANRLAAENAALREALRAEVVGSREGGA